MTENPSLLFEDQEAWARWLHEHHATSAGIWIQISKKNSTIRSLSYAEALDEALCYGWIDGQKKKGPEGVWLQRFTPRRERSIWSKVNRTKVLTLIEAGRMRPTGFAAIERARKNGQWDSAYDAVADAIIPDDLAKELGKHHAARAFFDRLNSQNRYAILFRLQTAKKPETRARRLAKFVEMLKRQETIYPQ
jgi:uncharacterized protein YdeI (YjbR/CyaY-like superfamily)